MGLILGLSILFLVIVLGDYFNDTIQSKEELEKESKLHFFCEIARIINKEETLIVEYHRSEIVEFFRGISSKINANLYDDDRKLGVSNG